MSRFARMARVLYIEPQRSLLTPFVDRQTYGWKLDFRFGLREEMSGLDVYSPLNPLPFSRVSFFDKVNDAFVCANIQRVIRRLKLEKPILWLCYTPKTIRIVYAIKQIVHPRLICYDRYDYYAGYAGTSPADAERIMAQERELMEMADVVFVVSPQLADKKSWNPNTFIVPNGVDMATYERPVSMPEDMASIPHPVVGFTGMIAGKKIDLALIRNLVEKRPDWSVVLVGPLFPDLRKAIAGWPRYKNLYLLGQKESRELPSYVKAFDVCLAPYLDNLQLRYCDVPLKVYEYLAVGKPVVATGLPPSSSCVGVVQLAFSPEEVIDRIEESLEKEDKALVKRRIEFAQQNSWDHRVKQIEELLTPLLQAGRT